VHVDPKTV